MSSFIVEENNNNEKILNSALNWFHENNGKLNNIQVKYIGDGIGNGIFANQDIEIQKGDVILELPLSSCMTIQSAKESSILNEILMENEFLLDLPDEIMSLHLMCEKLIMGEKSKFYHYIQSLPVSYDTPIFWSEEELINLQGTNVGLLTNMMINQINKDWENIYIPLFEKYPDVFSKKNNNKKKNKINIITKQDYQWAISTVYSRAVGFHKNDGEYYRCLPPILDMCNHSPTASSNLAEILDYVEDKDILEFKSGQYYAGGSQIYMLYGNYTNAKLLYSYGFVSPGNRSRGVDFWLKVMPTMSNAEKKQELIKKCELTRNQTYDFEGTIKVTSISDGLMATLRILELTDDEINDSNHVIEERIFNGHPLNDRNELACYKSLLLYLTKKMETYPTTIEADVKECETLGIVIQSLEKRESKTEKNIQQLQSARRRLMAIWVRLDDRMCFAGTAQYVKSKIDEMN